MTEFIRINNLNIYDIAIMAWLYQNYSVYQGARNVSEEWVKLTEKEQYNLYPLG